MKTLLNSIALIAGLSVASALSAETLHGSEWSPVEINAAVFEPVSEIFLRFEQDGRFFGNGGCNTYRGSFVTNEDAILFGPAAATMMACSEEISDQEYQFLQALNSVRMFTRDGIDLDLLNAEGQVLLRMKQRDAD